MATISNTEEQIRKKKSELSANAKFRNLKELCEYFDLKYASGGTQKAALISELHRHFGFHNEGHKIIIDEIYANTKAKEDRRSRGNHSIYTEEIEKIIIYNLIYHKHELSRVKYMTIFEMLNIHHELKEDDYQKIIKEISKRGMNLTKKKIRIYYKYIDRYIVVKGKSAIQACLNKMQKQDVLTWDYTVYLVKKGSRTRHPITDDEELFELYKKALEHAEVQTHMTESLANISGKEDIFYSKVKEYLNNYGYSNAVKLITIEENDLRKSECYHAFINPKINRLYGRDNPVIDDYIEEAKKTLQTKIYDSLVNNNYFKKAIDKYSKIIEIKYDFDIYWECIGYLILNDYDVDITDANFDFNDLLKKAIEEDLIRDQELKNRIIEHMDNGNKYTLPLYHDKVHQVYDEDIMKVIAQIIIFGRLINIDTGDLESKDNNIPDKINPLSKLGDIDYSVNDFPCG